MKIKILSLACVLSGLAFAPSGLHVQAQEAFQVANSPVRWYSYAQGMQLARKQNKHVYLQAWASWCGYCRKMDKETLTDTDVQKSLNRWFVPIRLKDKSNTLVQYQGQQITEDELMKRLDLRSFPNHIFYQPNGEELTRVAGYVQASEFDGLLKFVGTRAYTKMNFKEFQGKYAKYLKKS